LEINDLLPETWLSSTEDDATPQRCSTKKVKKEEACH
jgi:hypothetical protein